MGGRYNKSPGYQRPSAKMFGRSFAFQDKGCLVRKFTCKREYRFRPRAEVTLTYEIRFQADIRFEIYLKLAQR
jgi:hypothetical protein